MSHFTLFHCNSVMECMGSGENQFYKCPVCGEIMSFVAVERNVEKAKKALIPPKKKGFWNNGTK